MISVIVVILGALIMFAAVINCQRLLIMINRTEYAGRWKGLFLFMVAFLASYIAYAAMLVYDIEILDPDLLVSIVFLFGGLFVFLVVALNYSTFNGLLVVKQNELFTRLTGVAKDLAVSARNIATGADSVGEATGQISSSINGIANDAERQSKSISEAHDLIGQISMAMDQISKGAIEQSTNVSHTTRGMDELAGSINRVVGNAKTVSSVVSEGSAVALGGQEAVKKTIAGMERIRGTVLSSAGKIQSLGEKSKQIGEIIEVIDDIAEQTNLLALNAAIEAARAGEHGKGFAVVADEVRKLAERSAKATGEIAELIKGIQTETMEAVKAMERGTQDVAAGSELALDAGTAIEAMMSSINRVVGEISEITKAVEQISILSDRMSTSMVQIASVTEENTAITEEVTASAGQVAEIVGSISEFSNVSATSAVQMSASAQQQMASMQEITASVRDLSEMADVLYELVEKFQLSSSK